MLIHTINILLHLNILYNDISLSNLHQAENYKPGYPGESYPVCSQSALQTVGQRHVRPE